MAWTASLAVPPWAPRNLALIMRTFQFTPTTPAPLALAPIVPATCVPWSSAVPSRPPSYTLLSSVVKSHPFTSST